MSLRDTLSKPTSTIDPDWLHTASDTTKSLYKAASEEFERLKFLYATGVNISPKDRKINQTTVAKKADKDKSILSARRQPELMQWIQERNLDLIELQARPARPYVKPRSKSDLKSELAELKAENSTERLSALRAFVETVFSSNLLDERDILARENFRLKSKIDSLNSRVSTLQELNHNQAVEIAMLKNPRSTAKLKIVLKPDNE